MGSSRVGVGVGKFSIPPPSPTQSNPPSHPPPPTPYALSEGGGRVVVVAAAVVVVAAGRCTLVGPWYNRRVEEGVGLRGGWTVGRRGARRRDEARTWS